MTSIPESHARAALPWQSRVASSARLHGLHCHKAHQSENANDHKHVSQDAASGAFFLAKDPRDTMPGPTCALTPESLEATAYEPHCGCGRGESTEESMDVTGEGGGAWDGESMSWTHVARGSNALACSCVPVQFSKRRQSSRESDSPCSPSSPLAWTPPGTPSGCSLASTWRSSPPQPGTGKRPRRAFPAAVTGHGHRAAGPLAQRARQRPRPRLTYAGCRRAWQHCLGAASATARAKMRRARGGR